MNIGVVGYGYVGKAIARYFAAKHQVNIYDKYGKTWAADNLKLAINSCDLAFVAVPTPTSPDGWSCDLTEITETLSWIKVPVCIKSTIPPGTIDELRCKISYPLGFSPEYIGENEKHEWTNLNDCGFVIVGGAPEVIALVNRAYKEVNQDTNIYEASAKAAETCKYMENAFLAMKVAFVNQFYDIAIAKGVNFEELVSLWTLDPRIGNSHISVTTERGFGGKCLPKDIRAIIAAAKNSASMHLLESVLAYNEQIRMLAKLDKNRASLDCTEE